MVYSRVTTLLRALFDFLSGFFCAIFKLPINYRLPKIKRHVEINAKSVKNEMLQFPIEPSDFFELLIEKNLKAR